MTGAIGGLIDKHNKTGDTYLLDFYYGHFGYNRVLQLCSDKPGHLFDKQNGTFDKHNLTGAIGGVFGGGGNVSSSIAGLIDKHNKTGKEYPYNMFAHPNCSI